MKNKWRLPTKDELVELYRSGKLISSSYCWSSTPCASNTSRAWLVFFNNGQQCSNSKTRSRYVFCVRTKKNGKLKLQKNKPEIMNWYEAMKYADNLNKQEDIK